MTSDAPAGTGRIGPGEVVAASWATRMAAAVIDLAITLVPPVVVSALIFGAHTDAARAALVVPGMFSVNVSTRVLRVAGGRA